MVYDLWFLKDIYLVWMGEWDFIHALQKWTLRMVVVLFSYAMKIVKINVGDIQYSTWLYYCTCLYIFHLLG